MLDAAGEMHTEPTIVDHIIVDYFRRLFSGATSLEMEEVLDCVQLCVTDGVNA